MKKIIINFLILIIIDIIIIYVYLNKNNWLDKEFREYITSTYKIELTDNYKTGKNKKTGKKYGLYTPVNDPSYLIQIEKDGKNYICNYDAEALKFRKELMDEIIKYKKEKAVTSFLDFYKNGIEKGPVVSSYSSDTFLCYVIYTDSEIDIVENMKDDYRIMNKANSLLKQYYNVRLSKIMVYYINDTILLNKDWIFNQEKDMTYLILAPYKLFETKKGDSIIPSYNYSVGLNMKYDIELENMTESQFIEYGKLTLEKK